MFFDFQNLADYDIFNIFNIVEVLGLEEEILDSMGLLLLITELEKEYQIEISLDDLQVILFTYCSINRSPRSFLASR